MRLFGCLRAVRTVVCGLSGGVDSAVTALLLKRKGYNVVGLFMKNWDEKDEIGECMSDKDREDAKFVCDHLQIPLHEVNFVKEYWNEVFSNFIKDYQCGMTPNPDILCNKFIKFNAFFQHATESLGADAIATGHYVRTSAGEDLDSVKEGECVRLLKAVDATKDQTLFLSQVPQKALRRSIFPLGVYKKTEVKDIARNNGLERIARRKESMGICFIGKRNFYDFMSEYIDPKPGNFIHLETNEIVGTHKGIHNWTVGQRTLLAGWPEALFVVRRDPVSQDITVAPGTGHPALFTRTVLTEPVHWIAEPPRDFIETGTFSLNFRFQHVHSRDVKCQGRQLEDGMRVSLETPMKALVVGQYAVFYSGEVCMGSARIIETGPSLYDLNERDRIPLLVGMT